jgi:UDP-glucose 4-epimerase
MSTDSRRATGAAGAAAVPPGYVNKAVLVLGGLGFIGHHLSWCLVSAHARVTVVTRRRSAHRAEAARLEASGARIVEGDLRDSAAMRRAVSAQDVVFHLSARSGAVRSVNDPFTDLDVNCRGSLVLLEALRASNPRAKLVFVGSRLTYGRVGPGLVDEGHETDPLCAHAVHKLTVEKYLRVYGQLYGVPSVVARVTNPYGPGQRFKRTAYGVVNRMIHLALKGETIPVYGDGAQRRDYIFIDDLVSALLALGLLPEQDRGPYNIGTGIGTRLIDMARAIVAAVGQGGIELVEWPSVAEHIETGDFVADIRRVQRATGWAPAVSLEDGLSRTVAFYRSGVPQ